MQSNIDWKKIKIVITAGGSGGHVTVSTAVIDNLFKRGIQNDEILFIGGDLNKGADTTSGSVEQIMTQQINVPKVFIRAGKLQRKFSLEGIYLAFRTLLGTWDVFKIFLKIKPKIVVSFGGYVSLPVCLIAELFGKTIILHEQTAAVGLANKIVSLFSDRILVNFEAAKKYFRNKTVIHTGNPLRENLFEQVQLTSPFSEEIQKKLIYKRSKPFLYVTGGGQGSVLFNNLILDNVDILTQKYNILLQAGNHSFSQIQKKYKQVTNKLSDEQKNSILLIDIVKSEIALVLQNCDVVISRGGAGTISELGALQKKSIIIPIKWVTHNEQYKNAKILSDAGLATILDEDKLTIDDFINAIEQVLQKEQPSQELAKRIFKRNAAEEIGEIIVNYLS
ncbi:MAG TPA: UDP-N-acetylglucosamine--N-acetylmuramyl-(pentapeptide) pyrophosphoryl-undecaprenol N-acetylglucosamine transferase [Candidatus Dojkabacteria bacterium]|nr:UDP-N-acetylglucosamine--N-acetylmuramyl-(pentapeptide) pyrophosphoryl-undecaprenol N-acetylglucosamine transferase [Candidatus Dojkabacteria bacterium]HQF37186.1 UDP-N-acetylglucosamine--N-acetylmuramyl-(pentapeptide) pyrophosphoryl-undecaprenol N-acetylglucosamine transferase [Candidatus Dojkabacteria bacterium]